MDRPLARFLRMIALAKIIAFVFGLAIWYFAAEHSLERLYTVLFWCGAGWISVATLLFAGATDEYIAPRLSEGFVAARDGRGVPYASDLRYASARAFLVMFVPGALLMVVSAVLWRLSSCIDGTSRVRGAPRCNEIAVADGVPLSRTEALQLQE